MQIEEGFRDIKSHRFGLSLSYHRTSSVNRLKILLLIATLSIVILWLLGIAAILGKKHYQFQANSVRNRKVLSIMFVGFLIIADTQIRISKDDIISAWANLYAIQESFYE